MIAIKDKELLVNVDPRNVLIHGESKLFIDEYLWFDSSTGVASCYTVKQEDVIDHFEIFRGVDMIEFFGQTGISAGTVLECKKEGKTRDEMKELFRFIFLGTGDVFFHDIVRPGDHLISIARITSYKFRQMELSGTVFKVKNLNQAKQYFKTIDPSTFNENELDLDAIKVATISNIIGRSVKLSKFNSNKKRWKEVM